MIWMPIPGHPGYKANTDGQIMSLKGAQPRILSQRTNCTTPYLRVQLHHNGWATDRLVHQLIALAFLGPPPPGMHVCHKDGNPVNNRLGNLRYDTPAGNSQDAMKHGTHVGVRTAARTHCPQGHEFTPDNIYMRPSKSGKLYRKCKKCAIKRTLVSRAKRRAREKDFCTNGHQFTPENTTWRISRNGKKYRKCKRCWADTIARYRARKKAGLV